MEAKQPPLFESKRKNIGLIVSLIIIGLVAMLHIALVYIVMPYLDNYFVLQLPGRGSGEDAAIYLNTGEAAMIGLYALGTAFALGLVVTLFTLAKKYSIALGLTLLFTIPALLYILVMIGNIFWNLWGGWWSILGYAIGAILGAVPVYLLFTNIKINSNPIPSDKK